MPSTTVGIIVNASSTFSNNLVIKNDLRVADLNATTTQIDTLTVNTAVSLPAGSIEWADIGDVPTSTTDDLPEGSTNLYMVEEDVEDYVGGMLGGTETLITVTYFKKYIIIPF